MVLSEEDCNFIENLYYFKGYGAKRLISEFPTKGWKKTAVNDFLKHLKETGSTMRKSGSRRPRTVWKVANISAVNDLVLSQEDASQTHRTTWQIAREMGIHCSSVVWIIRGSYIWNASRNTMCRSWLRPTASPVWVTQRSCWVNFQKVPLISTSIQMRRYLQ